MHRFWKRKERLFPFYCKKICVDEACMLNYRIKFAYYFRVLQPWQLGFVSPDRHTCNIHTH